MSEETADIREVVGRLVGQALGGLDQLSRESPRADVDLASLFFKMGHFRVVTNQTVRGDFKMRMALFPLHGGAS